MSVGYSSEQTSTHYKSEKGQDLAEYGLLFSLIALVVFAGAWLFGSNLMTFWNSLSVPLPW